MSIIGIDLGTTNSLVSACTASGVRLVPNVFGEYLTPSIVNFDDSGRIYVGKIAKERMVNFPSRTFREFKRTMGTSVKYYKDYTATELSAFVLKQLKEDAERYLNEKITEAVISVPAYYNEGQRQAVITAGKLAGLDIRRLVNEPSAAALAYYLGKKEQNMFLVFDFGGGTLDVSIVDAFKNILEVQNSAADANLGGKDFNGVIFDYFIEKNGLDVDKLNRQTKQIIYKEAEMCKIALSSADSVSREVRVGDRLYTMSIDSKTFEERSAELIKRIENTVHKAIDESGLFEEEIDKVILAGGSCKMPLTVKTLSRIFKRQIMYSYSPDEIIAMGAGAAAGIKERNELMKNMILSDMYSNVDYDVQEKPDNFEEIFNMKIQSYETAEVKCIFETGQRLYIQSSDEHRDYILKEITNYRAVLATKDKEKIQTETKRIKEVFDKIDNRTFDYKE